MQKLWLLVNNLKIKENHKAKTFLLLNIIINGFLGLLTWLIIGNHFLPEST